MPPLRGTVTRNADLGRLGGRTSSPAWSADINAGSLTGTLTVTTGNASDNASRITTGSGATSITRERNQRCGDGQRLGPGGEHAADADRLGGRDCHRSGRQPRGRLADRGAERDHRAMRPTTASVITTGSAATSVTASGANDTVTVNATPLANNTALTLAGSAAEVVSGLIGNITASSLDRGAHRDHRGCNRQHDCDHHRLGGDLDHRQLQQRYRDGDRDRAGAEHDADAGWLWRRRQ